MRDFTTADGGLYIHIPYCKSKCVYCDFYSAGTRIADFTRLSDAIASELTLRAEEMPGLDTIYIGGGTPSVIPPAIFTSMIDRIRELAGDKWHPREFTVEVNPDNVDYNHIRAWADSGVTRISMGVQSFDDKLLDWLKRRHDSARALSAYSSLREAFDNISIDLMFGIPGQTTKSWQDSIRRAIQLKPEHISCYALMYETGTALTHMRDTGRIAECPDRLTEDMYLILKHELTEAGYEHYEISNYARPGYRSRHNSSYWSGTPYLGLGPSAHSYDGGRIRRANPSDLRSYLDTYAPSPCLQNTIAENTPYYIEENLDDTELTEEYILTRMRTAEGISLNDYETRFGPDATQRLLNNAEPYIASGTLFIKHGRLSLTDKGIMVSDDIFVSLSM